MTARMSPQHSRLFFTALAVAAALTAVSAQTKIVAPPNKYSVADDVKLGQEAAAEVRKELPLMTDRTVDDWVERIGGRLVTGIPADMQRSEFRYTFDEVNQKEINAFALPGGPMFLNRGMIEAANTEAEVAGVMAHEMSHVVLRHGTAGASKSTLPGLVGLGGQILGSILGGTAGSIIGLGSQVGSQAWMTKYSREYERQADLLGAQMMARAGYDPREMANMFKTIEAEGGGSGGPEFLSSHPNPGNRFAAITAEAQTLRVTNPIGNNGDFQRIQTRLRGMPAAYTAEQIAQMQKQGQVANSSSGGSPTGGSTGTAGQQTVRVSAPSGQYRTYQAGDALKVSVPSNWQQFGANNSVTYAPEGAYFQAQGGGSTFTHGVEVGVTQGTGNLQRDTQALLRSFAQSNPNLRQQGNARNDRIGGRTGMTVALSNTSEVTGQPEIIHISTTQLRDQSLLYVIGVAPQAEVTSPRF